MDMDIDRHSVPINELSEQLEGCNVHCPEIENNTPKESCKYLKNGKLEFNEPKLRPENHPLLAEKTTSELHKMPIEIPPAYIGLLASLVQDSEEPLNILANRINGILSPFLRTESLSQNFEVAIQKAIGQVATYVSYGLSNEVLASFENTSGKMPLHLYINRWEVENTEFFPIDMQHAIVMRRKQRIEMSGILSNFISKMAPAERAALMNTKNRSKSDEKPSFLTDEEKKKRDEEKRQKDEEKRQKDEEKKQREEEKRQKDEERRQRDEEKKKKREEERKLKEDQRKKREEEKKKKEQSQLRLTALFTKAAPTESNATNLEKATEIPSSTLFPPFHVKENVTLVEDLTHNRPASLNSIYDFITHIKSASTTVSIASFLSELSEEAKQKRGISAKVDIRTLLLPGSENILNAPNVRKALRMKLLQFTEDVRPAYYGTFTQKSDIITGRAPFALDTSKLDYEIDSEAEWEPEGEGEEIRSGDEEEEDADIIEPEDAGWLVPEGYLSDNEGVEGSDRSSTRQPNSSKKTMIRETVLGPYFEESEIMRPFALNFVIEAPEEGYDPFYEKPVASTENMEAKTSTSIPSQTSHHPKPEFTEEHKNALISVINGNAPESIPGIISEAKTHSILKDVSKRQLEAKIKDVAVKEKRGSDTKATWYIKEA
ncbi:hypothetical protein G6F56_001018 [Rhizopus delemar]|nr:hypothetical protein G6F56_001018 [Rhizopus delemar]